MTFKPLIVLVVLFALVTSARAQNPAPAKVPPFEFRITAWNLDLPDLFFEQDGKKQPTPVIERSLTQPFTYVSPTGKLVLYTLAVVDGASVKTPFAEVTLVPPPSKNIVLLWHEKSGRYGHAVLADDPQNPPPGHLRFVNLSGQDLAFVCNKQTPFTLAPGADRVVTPTKGGVGVGVKIARQRKKSADSWELALMSSIRVGPDQRVTAFVADPERLSLSARKTSIADYLEKEILSFFIISDTVTQ